MAHFVVALPGVRQLPIPQQLQQCSARSARSTTQLSCSSWSWKWLEAHVQPHALRRNVLLLPPLALQPLFIVKRPHIRSCTGMRPRVLGWWVEGIAAHNGSHPFLSLLRDEWQQPAPPHRAPSWLLFKRAVKDGSARVLLAAPLCSYRTACAKQNVEAANGFIKLKFRYPLPSCPRGGGLGPWATPAKSAGRSTNPLPGSRCRYQAAVPLLVGCASSAHVHVAAPWRQRTCP